MTGFTGLSGPRRAFAAGIAAIAVVTGGLAVATYVRSGGGTAGGEPRVIVVPGYGGNANSVASIAAALREAGRSVQVVELPDLGQGDIRRSAAALGNAIGDDPVDLVGHSAGGVVIRYWVRFGGGADQARRVVTLGSPHHGTTLAALLGNVAGAECAGACAQLKPESGLLADLNAGDETPGDATWIAVYTATDETVTPVESATLDGATNVRVQDACGRNVSHGGLARDAGVLRLVVRVLDGDPPSCA